MSSTASGSGIRPQSSCNGSPLGAQTTDPEKGAKKWGWPLALVSIQQMFNEQFEFNQQK